MRDFAELFRRLDETNKTNRKVEALRGYFESASAEDAAWALWFLTGNRLKRLIKVRDLAAWAATEAGVSDWMFEECYEVVGDLAETMALLLPSSASSNSQSLFAWIERRLLPLQGMPEAEQRAMIVETWRELSRQERFVWNKLITGEFRIGLSRQLVIRALAQHLHIEPEVIAHRLMGNWSPSAEFFANLSRAETSDADESRPYPFCLAHPLQMEIESLGDVSAWQAEWKWDGIRAQIIRRGTGLAIWSRGEDLISERFPDLHADAMRLPSGTVLDGEIVVWRDGQVMPFAEMQRRIGRKQLGKKLLSEVPARFIAFDLLEDEGIDVRERPLAERRTRLERILSNLPADSRFAISPRLQFDSWQGYADERARSREQSVEGLMLKRVDSPYGVGRVTGQWWKWKIEPRTVDAVLIYAQRGSGKRAALYTDYTFALWDDGQLVPFAKAYSGLTDEEIGEVDRFVRQNTLERFGPVRSVKPELVFELAFENIQRSTRHKSGIAVRFPRINRWRTDKRPDQADTLESLKKMIDTTP